MRYLAINNKMEHGPCQWRSQTFPDGGAQSFYRILSMITHRHAGSYVHLLKVVVCMEKA